MYVLSHGVYNNRMQPTPLGSFTRFFFGFTLLISISFGVTFAVQKIVASQEASKQQAAAATAMLVWKK